MLEDSGDLGLDFCHGIVLVVTTPGARRPARNFFLPRSFGRPDPGGVHPGLSTTRAAKVGRSSSVRESRSCSKFEENARV